MRSVSMANGRRAIKPRVRGRGLFRPDESNEPEHSHDGWRYDRGHMNACSWMRTAVFALLVVLVALIVAACDETASSPATGPTNLVTTSPWKLQWIDRPGIGVVRAQDPERFTLDFDGQGRVSVQADCNRCNGGYSIGVNQVTVGALACTRALCLTAPFDTDYVSVLGGESAVVASGATLELASSRGTLRFAK